MNDVLQPGELEPPKGEIPFLLAPGPDDLFASRGRRFLTLAENHPLGDYLRFMGLLARAQQSTLASFSRPAAPTAAHLDHCRAGRLPPLGVLGWRRDSVWRDGLARILAVLEEDGLPDGVRNTAARLRRAEVKELEDFAVSILNHDLTGVPAEVVPFTAAALQVYWTALAATLKAGNPLRLERHNLCPVCGSLPVAGLVRGGGRENGLRYLCCSLCASQWHMVRGICSNCAATKGITYFSIEGQPGVVTAESCDECHGYLKIVRLEKDPLADPVADDLATLSLDLLLDRSGRRRCGANLLFHPGNG